MLMRYVENSFTTAFYNTIGVDFVNILIIQKMKNAEVDGRKVRMQVVINYFNISGIQQDKIVFVLLLLPIIKELTE